MDRYCSHCGHPITSATMKPKVKMKAKAIGLFEVGLGPEAGDKGYKKLVKKGSMRHLNHWAKSQGMTFIPEPGSLFGGYWVGDKTPEATKRAYIFDVIV